MNALTGAAALLPRSTEREGNRMNTLSNVIKRIEKSNPDALIQLCTTQYGFFWYGKVKFLYGHLKPETYKKEVVSETFKPFHEHTQDGYIDIYI